MKIYVIIPVFNRLEHTKKVLLALRQQTCFESLRLVVVDDGSTDGTAEFLEQCGDVGIVRGGGDLWWAGAVHQGLKFIRNEGASDSDYVLLLNNDTWFDPTYVERLLSASKLNNDAAVGSVIHEDINGCQLVSIGPKVNINRIAVWDKLSELSVEERGSPAKFYRVDALSGRGTLYPARLFWSYGLMRPFLLPHYLADYELAMRFARKGVNLIVSTEAVVYSPSVYGNAVVGMSIWKRFFSVRSSANILRKSIFYMMVGSVVQRITGPIRMTVFAIYRGLAGWGK